MKLFDLFELFGLEKPTSVTREEFIAEVQEFQDARAECARNNGVKHCVFLTVPAPKVIEYPLVVTVSQVKDEVREFQINRQKSYA